MYPSLQTGNSVIEMSQGSKYFVEYHLSRHLYIVMSVPISSFLTTTPNTRSLLEIAI